MKQEHIAGNAPLDGLPLAGVTLVEGLSDKAPAALSLAAGMAGRIAADLGASVIRVTPQEAGGIDRASDRFLNRGKACFSVAQEEMDAFFRGLCDRANCMIVDTECAKSITDLAGSLLVILSMSKDSPLSGSEFTIEAQSGLLDLVGDPARTPLRLGGHQTAYAAGLAAYLAMISGLAKQDAASALPPRHVDLLEVAIWLNWKTLAVASRTGEAPTRKGANAEWSALPCKDGYFAAVYRSKDWETLKTVFDDPCMQDPRIQTAEGRRENRALVNKLLAERFAPLTRAEIHKLAMENKLPLGPVWSPQELRRSAHLMERQFLTSFVSEDEPVSFPALPVKWTGRTFATSSA